MKRTNRFMAVAGFVAVFGSILAYYLVSVSPVSAAVVSREQAGIDETLADSGGDRYAQSQKILVAQIPIPLGVRFGDSSDLYRGLYYYLIVHAGFVDIPFNYVVTWDGKVYEGKAGGNDVQPLYSPDTEDRFRNSVLIGYYGNNQEMTYAAQRAFVELLSTVQSNALVQDENVHPVIVSLASREENQPSRLKVTDAQDRAWMQSLSGILAQTSLLPPENVLTTKAKVGEVSYNREVNANENFVVTAEIENTGTIPWYKSGTKAVYLATSNPRNHESAFFVTDKWLSFTRVMTANEDWVLPGQKATFSFEVKTPLKPGEYKESFELLRAPDQWIDGSQFEIAFKVSAGDFDLVEILDTETGYLNVRDCPSAGCGEMGKVVPGQVLIKKGFDSNWYKVQLDDGREGWVFGKYVRDI